MRFYVYDLEVSFYAAIDYLLGMVYPILAISREK